MHPPQQNLHPLPMPGLENGKGIRGLDRGVGVFGDVVLYEEAAGGEREDVEEGVNGEVVVS